MDQHRSPIAASPIAERGFLAAVLPTVFPPLCTGCGVETGQPMTLCPGCWAETTFLAGPGCAGCGGDITGLLPGEAMLCDGCARHPRLWQWGRAALRYEGTGRRLILKLKHGDRLDIVPMLAGWMTRAGRPLLTGDALVVPVPLHWTRRLRRRSNQAAELGRAVAGLSGLGFEPGCLVRVRPTASQKGRSRAERALNLAGAFAVPPARRNALRDRRIVLIDDVLTTGATLDAAARALCDGGAARVDILVAALVSRAPEPYLLADADQREALEAQ